MSYDPVDEEPEPRCIRCGHLQGKHTWVGQPGYRLGDPESPRFGRCTKKKCDCVKYKEG